MEDVLCNLEGVKDALVVGVGSEYGERVKACIIRQSDEAGAALNISAVIQHSAAHLAAYKCPDIVEFFHDFPRTKNHKVFKEPLKYVPVGEAEGMKSAGIYRE